MAYDGNVYYSPEKWGFEVVAEVEYSDGDYQFDTRVVWRDRTTGTLYTARDSGCSCPTPFEDFMTLADLEVLNYEDLEREVRAEYGNEDHDLSMSEGQAFLRVVRESLNG
jgi:hypothetical protein